MEDPTYSTAIDEFAASLHSELRRYPNLPDDTEVVLHLSKDEEDMTKQYYLASAKHSSIFWLEKVDGNLVTSRARPLRDLTYISASHGPYR